MIRYLFYITLFVFVFTSCEKEVIPEEDATTIITGRSVNYTLQIILADNYTKATNTVINAEIKLSSVNGIITQYTDSTGRANFTNLASGIISVSVKYEGYTSVEMQVNLQQTNEDSFYDSNNVRNVSTMLKLFPVIGSNTAIIKGKIFADLNLANDTGLTFSIYKHRYEFVPFKVEYFVNVLTDQFYDDNFSGDGEILNISYSGFNISGNSDDQGNFEITVPASLNGLNYYLRFSDFEYDQTIMGNYPNTLEQRKIFYSDSVFVNVMSGSNEIVDIFYYY